MRVPDDDDAGGSEFMVRHFEARASADALTASAETAPSIRTAAAMRPLSVNFRAAQAAYTEVESSTLGGSDPQLQRRIGEGAARSSRAGGRPTRNCRITAQS